MAYFRPPYLWWRSSISRRSSSEVIPPPLVCSHHDSGHRWGDSLTPQWAGHKGCAYLIPVHRRASEIARHLGSASLSITVIPPFLLCQFPSPIWCVFASTVNKKIGRSGNKDNLFFCLAQSVVVGHSAYMDKPFGITKGAKHLIRPLLILSRTRRKNNSELKFI